jgi:hypothetical protein
LTQQVTWTSLAEGMGWGGRYFTPSVECQRPVTNVDARETSMQARARFVACVRGVEWLLISPLLL